MNEDYRPGPRTWRRKFRDAGVGVIRGVRGQSSFAVHFAAAAAVALAGWLLRVSLAEWALLALCVTGVLTAEMFNSALESLAKAIDPKHNLHLENGLNIASGAVLLAALGSAAVGLLVFGHRLGVLLEWW